MVKGNLLESDCDTIFHQCNCFSTMGSGIAKQIAQKYPEAKYADDTYSYSPTERLGSFSKGQGVHNGKGVTIVNLYGQFSYGRDKMHTNYQALESALDLYFTNEIQELIFLDNMSDPHGYLQSLKYGIPYNMGCGTGGGKWEKVRAILERIARKHKIQFHIYQL